MAATLARRPVTVAMPEEQPARKSWAKLVTATDRTQPGGYALIGELLRRDRAYYLPNAALVVTVDQHEQWHITLYRVEEGGLVAIKQWRQKSRIGPRIVDYIARRLPEGAGTMHARAAEHPWVPNRWDGVCSRCRNTVPAGTGWFRDKYGHRTVVHADGHCPPQRNVYDAECQRCHGWVRRREGVLSTPELGTRPVVEHAVCPDDPEWPPWRINRHWDWCVDCGERVAAGAGLREHRVRHRDGCPPTTGEENPLPGVFDECVECGEWVPYRHQAREVRVRHHDACPEPTVAVPTWRVYRRTTSYTLGEVTRQQILPRVSRGEQPVPPQAAGYRLLDDDGWCEAVVVVLDCRPTRRGAAARVRLATPDEASELLAKDVAQALQALPQPGFKSSWCAEKIGPNNQQQRARRHGIPEATRGCTPWLAELTGWDRTYGYRRAFVQAKWDYTRANSKGTRGIWLHWTLIPNRVYEAYWPTSYRASERAFLRTTPEGDVVYIDEQEVTAWLRHAASWADS